MPTRRVPTHKPGSPTDAVRIERFLVEVTAKEYRLAFLAGADVYGRFLLPPAVAHALALALAPPEK